MEGLYINDEHEARSSISRRQHPVMQAAASGNMAEYPKPHLVLIPFMAQGHMIPMIDLGLLLARRGVHVSLITSPLNASRIPTIISEARKSALPIDFVQVQFPFAEMGIPEGCENLDAIPTAQLISNFVKGLGLLQQPIEQYLRDHPSPPSCIINDQCLPWTRNLARNLGVPRLTFFSICTFSLTCLENLWRHKVYDRITSATEPFLVPGIPNEIEVTTAQAPAFFNAPTWEEFNAQVREAESSADGVVVNTFQELEPAYVELYEKVMEKKVWAVGPLSLYNRDAAHMSCRGNKTAIDVDLCMKWLDCMKPASVVYVSFGSLTHIKASQLIEIGMGLENCNHAFIWVIKNSESSPEMEEWLAGGFEERTRSRGLVIRGWAPQVMILSHPAVGGFMTHCGWNSTLEGICAGVPMITWPFFGDQFLNERFVVDVLQVGASVGVKVPNITWIEKAELDATREDVERAVRNLMDEGEEGKKRRNRAKNYSAKAIDAVKVGESSYENISGLIQNFSCPLLVQEK